MPVTITAGITFSGGGLTMEFGPPAGPTAGWYGGGLPLTSTIERITFATDTATASVRGPLPSARFYVSGVGNLTYGWLTGGASPAAPGVVLSSVERITYSNDTATTSTRGPLNVAKDRAGAGGTVDYGWIAAGYDDGSPGRLSSVARITYATDTATASVRGSLVIARMDDPGVSDNVTYGWFGGGYQGPAPVWLSSVERITYATDTATATARGPLSIARGEIAGSSIYNTTYGWFGGGNTPAIISTIDRITYATDTATASVRGPLNAVKNSVTGTGDPDYGWFAGGSPNTDVIQRVTYANDTATAAVRGALTTGKFRMSGTSGIQ